MKLLRIAKRLFWLFSRRLACAVALGSALLMPTGTQGQARDTLVFPLSYVDSYPEQTALGLAWSGTNFTQEIPALLPDTLSFPAQTSFAQIDATPVIGLVLVRLPAEGADSPGILAFSLGKGHFREEGRIQIPESGQTELQIRVPTSLVGQESPGNPGLTVNLMVEDSGRIQHQFAGIWVATLETGDESLAVGVQRLAGGSGLVFADAEGDGDYESYLQSNSTLGLGGRFWTVAVDFEESRVALRPTDQAPVDVGWQAPDLAGPIWGSDSTYVFTEGRGKTAVLVFCKQRCFACRGIRPELASLFSEFHGDPGVHLLSIVTSEEEAQGSQNLVSPGWLQVVSPEAWTAFAVTPTPTLLVVGPDGVVAFRQVGGTPALGEELAEEIRKLKR